LFSGSRCSDGGSNKEKDHLSLRHIDEQQIYITATHVRALIDDEAEDEDEDLLADNVEEEEAVADEEEFRDLIASTQEEKVGDQSRRAALHRKWLQQQAWTVLFSLFSVTITLYTMELLFFGPRACYQNNLGAKICRMLNLQKISWSD
jgi:cation transport ATPase